MALLDAVMFVPASAGAGSFVVNTAVQGYRTPAAAGAVNGAVYSYRAESSDLSQWEVGFGTYTSGTTTLARTTVVANSAGTTAAIGFAAPPNVGVVELTKYILSFDTLMGLNATEQNTGRYNLGIPALNLVDNSDFRVNERGYASGGALAAGAFGHDRWKGGAAGGGYTFTQLASSTAIVIAASKTMVQVIAPANIVGGNYVLSWAGTCQARVGVNTATPAGAYAASPILITGQNAGGPMSIEFGNGASTGTLGTAKLEPGVVATPYESKLLAVEISNCSLYARRVCGLVGVADPTTTTVAFRLLLSPPMASNPASAFTIGAMTASDDFASNPVAASPSISGFTLTGRGGRISINGFAGLTVGRVYGIVSGDIFVSSDI